jgi:hypothetical protein
MYPRDRVLRKEEPVVEDEFWHDVPSPSTMGAKAKGKHLANADSESGVEEFSDSLEVSCVGRGWLEIVRRPSVGSWVEMGGCAEWDLGDEDQGLLAQRLQDNNGEGEDG